MKGKGKTDVVGGGVPRHGGVQQIGYGRFLRRVGRVGVRRVEYPVRPRRRAFFAVSIISLRRTKRRRASNAPILIHLPELILIAALELPKLALAQADERAARGITPLAQQLIVLLQSVARTLARERLPDRP